MNDTKLICGRESRHGIVGVVTRATGWTNGKSYFEAGSGKNFIFFKLSICGLRSAKRLCQVLPVPLSPVIKRLGCESDHAPQSVAELGMRVVNLKFPICRQMGCTIKHNHKLTVSQIYFRIADKY